MKKRQDKKESMRSGHVVSFFMWKWPAKTLEKFYTTYDLGKLFHLFGTIWNIRTVWGSIRKNPILISRDKKSREIARDLYKVTTKLQKNSIEKV